jgi:hypothetical protein
MLHALDINGREIVDFGAGDGRVLFAAMAAGASRAVGFELHENKAHKFVFDAVCKRLASANTVVLPNEVAWSDAEWFPRDINFMREVPCSPHCVYTFWVGMPFETQERVLSLCARCPSIDAIAVFRDHKWPKPENGPPTPLPRN